MPDESNLVLSGLDAHKVNHHGQVELANLVEAVVEEFLVVSVNV